MTLGDADRGPESLKDRLLKGSAWTIGMRWSIKALGFISTVILARILVPADFGLVAIAVSFNMIAQTLTELGVRAAIIQTAAPDAEHYATAWTIQIFQGVFVGAALAIAAFVVPQFLNDSRLFGVLLIFALAQVISGFSNSWTISLQKEMRFRRDFAYLVLLRLIRLIITIALTLILRNYWAIVFGVFSGRVIGLIASYIIVPKRPYLTLSKFDEMWTFSKWYLLKNIADVLFQQSDRILLGRLADARTVGLFSVSSELSTMVSGEVVAPAARALMPGFVSIRDQADRLRTAFLKSLGATATIVFPTTVGLALVAEFFVRVVFGPNWVAMIPILEVLAFAAIFESLDRHGVTLLLSLGKIRYSSFVTWTRTILLYALFPWSYLRFGLEGAAWLKVGLSAFGAVAIIYVLQFIMAIRFVGIVIALWRPALATGLMALVVAFVRTLIATNDSIIGLLILVFAGVGSYALALFAVWLLSGRPDGLESIFAQRLGAILGATRTDSHSR